MIAHRVSQLAPDSEAIPLAQMPQQVGVRKPEDDWTGVISQNERRKLQNRLNQRAYRAYIHQYAIIVYPTDLEC